MILSLPSGLNCEVKISLVPVTGLITMTFSQEGKFIELIKIKKAREKNFRACC